MNPAEIRRAIDRLRPQMAELESNREQCYEALDRALAAEPSSYDENAVRNARTELARIEERLKFYRERIANFEKDLPGTDAVRQAKVEFDALVGEVEAARERFATVSRRFTAAVDDVEAAARELVAVRQECGPTIARLKNLVLQFGLDVRVPQPPSLPPGRAKIASLVGRLVGEAAIDEPNPSLMHELETARAGQS